jgi:hypothetical protein
MSEERKENEHESLRRHLEDAPTLGESSKAGQEIKVRRSPWVLRSVTILFALLLVVEGFLILRLRSEAFEIIIRNPPAVLGYPAPPISDEVAPPIEPAPVDEDVFPTPTVAPPTPTLVESVPPPFPEEEQKSP